MSLIRCVRCQAGEHVACRVCDEVVEHLCRLYPEIESWHPPLIAEAWSQWVIMQGLALTAPVARDEAFPLYLVRLIRQRMDEMIRWCS